MADRSAPRFALEAVFLIALAVAAGLADLRPMVIVVVMAGAWLLVSIIEWLAWRAPAAPVPAPRVEARPAPLPGWDVEEILVPADEVAAYSQLEEGEALTSVLPESAGRDATESKPRRRWLRRSE